LSHQTHHLFISYSRKDNLPRTSSGEGWITAFYHRLQAQHQRYTGRELKIFFDTKEIDDGSDWRRRLGQGLRTSNLFLAFMSPNYIRSPNCRWEWEEYLRREHTLARGDDGVATVYFEVVPGMPGADENELAQLREELCSDPEIANWLEQISIEMNRRNIHQDTPRALAAGQFNPQAAFDLRAWFNKGPEILAQLDVAERLAELKKSKEPDPDHLLTLSARLEEIDKHISTRLDRCLLAELAPGQYSLGRRYQHFVGRHRELRELHQTLLADRMGIITAVHGLGGQGKTALAIQYAHAYAEFYATGGRWVVSCEGIKTMPDALLQLAIQPGLNLRIPDELKADPELAATNVLLQLEKQTQKAASALRKRLREHHQRMSEDALLPVIEPRILVILDNVDQPDLLAATQTSLLPQTEWFELVVTTRLDPQTFGLGRDLHAIPIDSLPQEDAVALIREFQPDQRFATAEDEQAARNLCDMLGGYTLAIELAAAYLGEHPEISPAQYCEELLSDGLTGIDDAITEIDEKPRHREKQLTVVLEWTLTRLSEPAKHVLEHACWLDPESIVTNWMRQIVEQKFPDLTESQKGPDQWLEIWRELAGLRLLTASTEGDDDNDNLSQSRQAAAPRLANIHRLIADHLRQRMSDTDQHERLAQLQSVLFSAQQDFDGQWHHNNTLHWQLQPLGDNALQLQNWLPISTEIALACGVSAQAEQAMGLLSRAEMLINGCHNALQRQHLNNTEDDQGKRLYSTSLSIIGDFYLSRGQAGDAELALQQFENSLHTRQQLFEANPNSAQAARDLVVSHYKLDQIYNTLSQEEKAAESITRCFSILDQMHREDRLMDQPMRDLYAQLASMFE